MYGYDAAQQRISRTLAFWGSMGRILVRYYLQERDLSATEEQWQVRGVSNRSWIAGTVVSHTP